MEILNGLIQFTLFLVGKFNSKVEQIESRTASWNGLCSTSEGPLYNNRNKIYLYSVELNNVFIVLLVTSFGRYDHRTANVMQNLKRLVTCCVFKFQVLWSPI